VIGTQRGTKLGIGERRAVVIGVGALAWLVGLLWIFPVAWTVLTSFKTEDDAAAQTLHQGLSFGRYSDVGHATQGTLSLQSAFTNSLVVVVVSTTIVMLLALPAAYALAIRPIHKWRDVLFFFISTKFLPYRRVDLPDLRVREKWNLIGTRTVLIILYIAINLPLAIWMLRSFFKEIPRELIEAAEIDGTNLYNQLRTVIPPDRSARHRRHSAALRDLRVERVLLCAAAQLRERLDHAAMGDLERLDPRQLPGEALGGVGHRVSAGRHRRLGDAEAHDPRALDGRAQVKGG
jgi:ABC-type spermidine/putrescine transport system permease subunit II